MRGDFVKHMIGLGLYAYELISFKLDVVIDTTKLHIFVPV